VQFPDQTHKVQPSAFDTLYFGGVGSMTDYWKKASYGTLQVQTVNAPATIGWLTAPEPYSYYVNASYGWGEYPHNSQRLAEDLVDLADPKVDFSKYDNDHDGVVDALVLVHSGGAAEVSGQPDQIWSHMWGVSPKTKDGVKIAQYAVVPEFFRAAGDIQIGVTVHEMGHLFGLPDLYGERGST
jgi:immune inhibitor A